MAIIIDLQPLVYMSSIKIMEDIVDGIVKGKNTSTIWLLEHMPVYTVGYTTYSSWVDRYSNNINGVPLIETERGGQITYHGPGQRVCYCMIDLRKLYGIVDLKKFLTDIHRVIIGVLSELGIEGVEDQKYPGVWVKEGNKSNKIAAVGIKIRKGVSYHGFALNVNTDLSFFNFIEPCGINERDRGVTSIKQILGREIPLSIIDINIIKYVKAIFGIENTNVY